MAWLLGAAGRALATSPRVSGEGRAVSAAVRAAKARQRASDLSGIIADLRTAGATSLRDLAAGLNTQSIPTPRGGTWSAVQVARVLAQAKV